MDVDGGGTEPSPAGVLLHGSHRSTSPPSWRVTRWPDPRSPHDQRGHLPAVRQHQLSVRASDDERAAGVLSAVAEDFSPALHGTFALVLGSWVPWRFALAFGFFAAHALSLAAADAQSSARSPVRGARSSPQRCHRARIAPYIPVIGRALPTRGRSSERLRLRRASARRLGGRPAGAGIPYVGIAWRRRQRRLHVVRGPGGHDGDVARRSASYGVAVLRGDAIWRERRSRFQPLRQAFRCWRARWTTSNAISSRAGFSYDGAATHGYRGLPPALGAVRFCCV